MRSDVLPWIEYHWNFDFPAGMFRAIVERLRGTPARLEGLLREATPAALARRIGDTWSVQQHAGHLWSVEALWQVRLREYLRGESVLTAADMANRATEGAGYDARPVGEILAGFEAARSELVAVLDALDPEEASRVAHHPRLDRPMRLVDMCLFAAEHDDHHLAAIHVLLA